MTHYKGVPHFEQIERINVESCEQNVSCLGSSRTFVSKVGLGWVPGGSSHTEPEEVRLEP